MPLYFNHQKIGRIYIKKSSAGENGGTDTSDATLTSGAQMLSPYTAYSKGVKITGNIPSKSTATITPGKTDQEIAAGQYLEGKQTIKGDANLLPANIKRGVSIFGVNGTMSTDTVPVVEQATATITVSSSGLITASATQEAGQVSAGTKSATKQMTTQAEKTITPSTNEQTAVEPGVYATGSVKVAAMPSGSIGTPSVDSSGLVTAKVDTSGYLPSGTKKTLQLTTQGDQTITPGTSDKTIASGRYLIGTQTIKGDANLVAGNIKSGVSIFGVAGTYEGSSGSGGSSENNCEAYHITRASNTINFHGTGTVKVWGYGVANASYNKTIYAFVGDGYYKGSYYGTPSKTNATFSINSNGTLSGLPSGLTSVDLLVTVGV